MYQNELYHHGVKGMKWGVRRYQNKDGSLTPRGVKRAAIKGYSEDAYKRNKTSIGRAYDKITGAHKYSGQIEYANASKKQREERAKKYVADQKNREKAKNDWKNKVQKTKDSFSKGEKTVSVLMGRGFTNGYAAAKTAGYSKGKAVVVGFMSGKVGALRLRDQYVAKKTQ